MTNNIGFLNVYKPSGMTSAAVVGKIKRNFKIKKIGHLGTLDPMATGVLGLAVGKATRMFDYFLLQNKSYRAVFTFGYETDTLDIDGKIIKTTHIMPTKKGILEALPSFVGKLMQTPPNFSAKHVNGKRAYELARDGKKFKLPPKQVQVFSFNFLAQVGENAFEFEIECSSGTYIRSLCRDLGYKLNSLATMTSLERTKNAYFTLDNASSLEDILKEKQLKLIPVENIFSHFDRFTLTKQQYEHLLHGRHSKLEKSFSKPTFLVYNSSIIGVAKLNTTVLALQINLM